MPKFKKGHKKYGGRVAGVPNKATVVIKALLAELLPREELAKRWMKALNHRNKHIQMKAFELANHYMFGKPITTIVGEESAPPIKIDISAIPKFRVPAKPE